MLTLKRILLWHIGPSPWEFAAALLVLVYGVCRGIGGLDPVSETAGAVSPVPALFLALDAVRVWHRLSVIGRIVTTLFILLLGMMCWGILEMAYDVLRTGDF